jgi:hypothetical protein
MKTPPGLASAGYRININSVAVMQAVRGSSAIIDEGRSKKTVHATEL